MHKREDLQTLLEELLGSRNVYYNPPATVQMNYPAIVYTKTRIESKFANDAAYSFSHCYELTVIDKKSDNPVIYKLLRLPYCSYETHYKADNLNHDKLRIYYK